MPAKRKSKRTPTNLSLELLRETGWAEVVEHRIPYSFITKDLWGFDILALQTNTVGVLAVQTTSMGHGNIEARIKKIQAIPEAWVWLHCKNRIAMHAWGLRGKRGQKKEWKVKIVYLALDGNEVVALPF